SLTKEFVDQGSVAPATNPGRIVTVTSQGPIAASGAGDFSHAGIYANATTNATTLSQFGGQIGSVTTNSNIYGNIVATQSIGPITVNNNGSIVNSRMDLLN